MTCEKHGEYRAENTIIFGHEFKTQCPKCIQEKLDEDESERLGIEKKQNEERLESMGIRKRFYYSTFDTYRAETKDQEIALTVCRDFAERKKEVSETGENLFLVGMPGTGKNHLACSIVREFGNGSIIVKASDMIRNIRESYRKDSIDTEQYLIEKYASYRLLAINEIGVQFGTEAEKNIIFEVIDLRYENMLPTIFISNLNLQEIKNYIGDRVIDRMMENGKVVIFNWKSFRRKS